MSRNVLTTESLVTVIVPVYNVEAYLERCIESIVEQSYKKIEIILVDDGITDDNGRVAGDLAAHNTRVKVMHKTDGSLPDARNYGLKGSSGAYIIFIDSVDNWEPNLLKDVSEFTITNNLDVAIFGYYVDSYIGGSRLIHSETVVEPTKIIKVTTLKRIADRTVIEECDYNIVNEVNDVEKLHTQAIGTGIKKVVDSRRFIPKT